MRLSAFLRTSEKNVRTVANTARTIGEFALMLPFGAFTPGIAHEIMKRDHNTCVECGKAYREGWMLHASHFDHSREHDGEQNPNYNRPENGDTRCLECHWKIHFELMQADPTPSNVYAFQLLSEQIYKKGYHIDTYLENSPEALADDRDFLITSFVNLGLNPDDFLHKMEESYARSARELVEIRNQYLNSEDESPIETEMPICAPLFNNPLPVAIDARLACPQLFPDNKVEERVPMRAPTVSPARARTFVVHGSDGTIAVQDNFWRK